MSTRIGPRVGTDFPTGSGGFNTVAGVTAEGWYSASGFVRIDPQVKTLHTSMHVQEENFGLNAFKASTIDADVQSSATFVELPLMVGFRIIDSTQFQPLVAFGVSLSQRLTSTTTTQGMVTSYPDGGEAITRPIQETHSEDTRSEIGVSICALAGISYTVSSALDLRFEVRGSYITSPMKFWEYEHSYTGGSSVVMLTTAQFYTSLMCSAIFRL